MVIEVLHMIFIRNEDKQERIGKLTEGIPRLLKVILELL
jgi:hypothetical protein